MAEGAMLHGMLHNREDFSLPVEIDERYNLFDMMWDVDFGTGHGFNVAFCGISQSHEGIPMFKKDGMGFCVEESFAVRGVFYDLVVFPGPVMACDELFLIIERDKLLIGLKGDGA